MSIRSAAPRLRCPATQHNTALRRAALTEAPMRVPMLGFFGSSPVTLRRADLASSYTASWPAVMDMPRKMLGICKQPSVSGGGGGGGGGGCMRNTGAVLCAGFCERGSRDGVIKQ